MSNVLPFLFNTLRARAIDPANSRFFLPTVLAGISGSNSQGKLLPIEEDSWSIGAITGNQGSTISTGFVDNWATFLQKVQHVDLTNQFPIPSPQSPSPILNLGDATSTAKIVIGGLQNVFVLPNPTFTPTDSGYSVVLALQFSYWDGSNQRPTYPVLSVAAPYKLAQSLCLASRGSSVCNGNASTNIDGGGTVSLSIANAFVDAVLNISIDDTGSFRTPVVTVGNLTLRGPNAGTPPQINVDQLTIDASVSQFLINVWKTLATNAFESRDGCAGIVGQVNAALQQPSNLASLSTQMTSNLGSMLDGMLGAVDSTFAQIPVSTSSTNPVDQYLFDRLRFALNTPSSSLFLPHLLAQSSNPSLSPLQVAQIALPDFTFSAILFTNNSLSNLNVLGLTNVQTAVDTITLADDGTVQFTGVLGGWNPPPSSEIPAPPAKGTAAFSVGPTTGPIPGTLTLTLIGPQINGAFLASGSDDSDLNISFSALSVVAPNVVSNMSIRVNITSPFFQGIINSGINTPSVLQSILDKLNAQISGDLGGISEKITSFVQTAVANGLA
jgi:hypothetical protein